ncbi:MAG: amidohydrolase [Gammaproteobacteria bacterium]
MLSRLIWLAVGATTLLATAVAEMPSAALDRAIAARAEQYGELAQDIWDLAEMGYLEFESSAKLQNALQAEGFKIETGIADIPTAFTASYGRGKPVIAIMGEFDALPGLSQGAVPERSPIAGQAAGHGCGHHLFGVGSLAAAVAVKDWLAAEQRPGTIRFYGTPAEEGGSGKVYMGRAGAFDDVDVALHWHPDDNNDASPYSTLANRSAKFKFVGRASHAAQAPDAGRSALDGVEAMNFMTNLMREHMPLDARIHYVITNGGSAPNVVPAAAEVFYYVRGPNAQQVEELFARVVAAAEGAASGTETQMSYEIIHGNHSVLPNEVLAQIVDDKLRQVGGVQYTPVEQNFAIQLATTLVGADKQVGSQVEVQPFKPYASMGSTDVGDVSWVVPTTGLRAATWVPGTGAHTWQAVAAGGTSIGSKGMFVAARTLAMTAAELMADPSKIPAVRAEFERRRGADFEYRSLLGDRAPPLDYRK